ncbi:hypothetical protein ACJX0J_007053, partial [Zea mays]
MEYDIETQLLEYGVFICVEITCIFGVANKVFKHYKKLWFYDIFIKKKNLLEVVIGSKLETLLNPCSLFYFCDMGRVCKLRLGDQEKGSIIFFIYELHHDYNIQNTNMFTKTTATK